MNPPSDARFDPLFASLTLGGKTASNRFVFAAHQTNFATHNRLTERHTAYYEARAAGGTGLIVLEGSVVHPSDWPYEYAVFGYDAAIVDGYRQVAEAVHRHGALALAHLTHSGMQGTAITRSCRCGRHRRCRKSTAANCPRRWTLEDIAAVIEGFRQAARYAVDGGLDGIEINAGQDSLIRQFLSPLTNQRGDDYGGSLDHRLRFARQVIAVVRDEVGRNAIVGLRLAAMNMRPGPGSSRKTPRNRPMFGG
jgi:2,4-dienoyl-CoA reductase-like NADH-dependent reductase (Old Yellow Enzyme family)